ncbi:MAG: tetratricopeptide repeat protein [Saccharospirillaceae bacterium]|nr:tetratricopeptide repeat protein [Saccharospirillaceae bacterium]
MVSLVLCFWRVFAADAGDFDTAVTELNGVIASAEEGPIKYTAQARLANILIQQEKMDEALALVATVPDAAYATQFEEAKGDALFRKGELSEARAAYIRAQEAAANLGLNTQQLQRKIDNLAASGDA